MSCKSFLDCLNYLKQKREKTSHECKQKGSRADSAGGFPGCPCGDLSRSKRCIDYADTRSKASCSENNKTYTLDKTGDDFQTICMHVDGGIVDKTDHRERCDYAFFLHGGSIKTDDCAIFIELKGVKTKKALEQLLSTVSDDIFGDVPKTHKKIFCRIVNSSSAPRIRSTPEYTRLQKWCMDHNGNLKMGERTFLEKYAELDKLK